MTDLEYIQDGLFIRFIPNTVAGECAWREMAKNDGVAAVLSVYAGNVLKQLRKSGYSVRKAKKSSPVTIQEIDNLLTELAA